MKGISFAILGGRKKLQLSTRKRGGKRQKERTEKKGKYKGKKKNNNKGKRKEQKKMTQKRGIGYLKRLFGQMAVTRLLPHDAGRLAYWRVPQGSFGCPPGTQ